MIHNTGTSHTTAAEPRCLSLRLCTPHTLGSLPLLHNGTLKDDWGPKPGRSLLTCLQAFLNMISYFKSFLHTYLCTFKFKEGVGRTTQKLPRQFVFEQGYVLLNRKTPSSLLHQSHRSYPYIKTTMVFWQMQKQTRACTVSKDVLSPKNPCQRWRSQFHSCSSTQEK